jgi:hypothetical protein
MLVLRFASVEEQKREEDNRFFTIFGHCFSTKLNTCDIVYKPRGNLSIFKFSIFFFFFKFWIIYEIMNDVSFRIFSFSDFFLFLTLIVSYGVVI